MAILNCTRQMLGQWKVNNVDMISLHKEAREVAAAFDEFKIVHVLRVRRSTHLLQSACNMLVEFVDDHFSIVENAKHTCWLLIMK
jgi:hypothetical protein